MGPRKRNTPMEGDEELVRLAKSGDREASRALIEAYEQRIFRTLHRLVGDVDVARDLAQETFLRALKGLAGYHGRARFSTWLTSIAINVARSFWSSREHIQQARRVSFDPQAHEVPEQSAETVEKEERLAHLRRALSTLREEHRQVVVLCWLEERGYDEVAQLIGIPYGTVCSRLHSALKALRIAMRQEGL